MLFVANHRSNQKFLVSKLNKNLMWESMGLPLMFCPDVKRKHSKLKIILIKYYSPFLHMKGKMIKTCLLSELKNPIVPFFHSKNIFETSVEKYRSLLSPLTVDMFLHLSKHKRVLFTSLVGYRVPKKMKDLKSWPVSTNFDLMKRLSLIIYFFFVKHQRQPTPMSHLHQCRCHLHR